MEGTANKKFLSSPKSSRPSNSSIRGFGSKSELKPRVTSKQAKHGEKHCRNRQDFDMDPDPG
jgi:hypothetical protein